MAPRKGGKRTTLATNIYQDKYGISAIVYCKGLDPERARYPLGTDVAVMQAWQLRTEAEMLERAPVVAEKGTLAADAPRWIAMMPEGRRRDDFALNIKYWIHDRVDDAWAPTITKLGNTRRDKITGDDIDAKIAAWLNAGLSPYTINHRVRALRTVYRDLDGRRAYNPTQGIQKLKGPRREPRDVPIPVIERLIANMPDQGCGIRGQTKATGQPRGAISQTKIRIRVMAWTGAPQMNVERFRDRDIDLTGKRFYYRPRRKGAGADGVWLDMIPPAVDAFRDFVNAGLVGKTFSRNSMKKAWRGTIRRTFKEVAVEAAQTGDQTFLELLTRCIPPKCRPYDLRHSFLSAIANQSGDPFAVMECGQLSSLAMAQHYTKGVTPARAAAAIATLSARWLPPVPAKPRLVTTKPAPKRVIRKAPVKIVAARRRR